MIILSGPKINCIYVVSQQTIYVVSQQTWLRKSKSVELSGIDSMKSMKLRPDDEVFAHPPFCPSAMEIVL
jgi:hypothetical protein